MHVPNYVRIAVVAIAFSLPMFTHAQQISPQEKTAAVQAIAHQIAANYVYAEQGGQIASHIQTANHRGEFKNAQTWQQFDEMITESIRKFSSDRHLYVKYDPQEVKALRPTAADSNRMFVAEPADDDNGSGISEVKIMGDDIGYLKLSHINLNTATLPQLEQALSKLENTSAMIIDLRDNPGGGSEVGAAIESYFLPASTPLLDFTSRKGEVKRLSTISTTGRQYKKPVYIIVNRKTASAAEAIAFTLQQHGRAKIVGETSAGAAYMNEWFPIDEHSYVSVSTSVPHLPGTDLTWEGTGVKPDIKVRNGDPVQVVLGKINQ